MKKLNKATLKKLEAQTGSPSITIVLGTDVKSFAAKEQIQLKIKNAIKEVSDTLRKNYDEIKSKKLINKIKELIQQIDLNHSSLGVGIYVTESFHEIVSFPFPVSDKVRVATSFEVSEILETYEKMIRYYVLALSKNETRLFKGMDNSVLEIKDSHFPLKMEDEFQVSRKAPHSFYNDEESKIDQARMESFLRKVDVQLGKYLKSESLILLGVKENLGDFKSVSQYASHIIIEMHGNFDRHSERDIEQLVWPKLESNMEEMKNSLRLSSHE
ncbi:hypothetical protein [Reichenbachiella sp. MALMAid0571]|uniref:baeRF3 domain-containing protein n=1 Tax=Reichenbachiella sp. MALMAid0571 TaxID=3143939 RepID=UPI0032DFB82F